MFPQVAPKFFHTRAEGPKNLGKDPGAAPAAAPQTAAPTGARAPLRGTAVYDVKWNGQSHRVSVTQAE